MENRRTAHIENDPLGGATVIVCEHASCNIPAHYHNLGLSEETIMSHIGCDSGALETGRRLAGLLSSPLVHCSVSRLVVDCNRTTDAPDLFVEVSDNVEIPGNAGLSDDDRRERLDQVYYPFHRALENTIHQRLDAGLFTAVISVHSFTPVYKGERRHLDAGIIHVEDVRLADPLLAALGENDNLTVGRNEPYSPSDGVFHTLEAHGLSRRLPHVMIEIRNDLIALEEDQNQWARRLFDGLAPALQALSQGTGHKEHLNVV